MRRNVARLLSGVLAATLGAAGSPAVSAGARSSYSAAEAATPPSCEITRATATSDGRIAGFGSCWAEEQELFVVYVERVGADWRVEPTTYRGRIHAVADDGTTTYALLDSADGGVVLLRRRRDGSYLPQTTLHSLNGLPTEAALIARDGRWWAVWTYGGPLFDAHTIAGGKGSARQITFETTHTPSHTLRDESPSLVLREDGRALLAWSHTWGYQSDNG
ncbi:MAG: hypothetical protein ABR520_00660, partial [Mycobacteriales bacterium]